MTRFRHPAAGQRAWLLLLLALTLAVRLLVPTGWMVAPVAGHGAAMLIPCSGTMPRAATPHMGMHHGSADDRSGHPAPEQPCAFAGLGIADEPAAVPMIVARPLPTAAVPSRRPTAVAVGRGLAAPPPPATGPPAFA